MNFKSQETEQKLRGAYYTPPKIAEFLARWVMGINPQNILEPSCGDGVFFTALESVSKKAQRNRRGTLEGIDIDSKACDKLYRRIKSGDYPRLNARVQCRDFLSYCLINFNSEKCFDAVIGNPPFIRYQYVGQDAQVLTERIFKLNFLPFTKHTNAWVPFLIQGLQMLRPGGRLAMVIPSEIMHVLHAKPVRDFVLRLCSRVHVVHVEDLFSAGVLQGIVLLLCEKRLKHESGPTVIGFPEVKLAQLDNGVGKKLVETTRLKDSSLLGRKWMEGLLSDTEFAVYKAASETQSVLKFVDIADVDVGIVTGANKFFLVPDEVVSRFALHKFAGPMFGRSDHVRGVIFSRADFAGNRKDGLPTNFLQFPSASPHRLPPKVREYIKSGEDQGLHKRYKCRIREPWYCVPSVWVSEISMLKRAHATPRLILNHAGAYTTDTAYRIRMRPSYVGREKDFVGGFINSLTALSAELEGRHYGGGVIELVPSEIERLVIPLTRAGGQRVQSLDVAFRQGRRVADILCEQDAHVLREVGLSREEITTLHNAWLRLMRRRLRAV
ncbi:MAG: SAM-dependent DNA methyltransferase [Elusimicrobia bacterium]|nr:SAM-dependent DNA methyltransferase [Elusimicrobiota bacterium]